MNSRIEFHRNQKCKQRKSFVSLPVFREAFASLHFQDIGRDVHFEKNGLALVFLGVGFSVEGFSLNMHSVGDLGWSASNEAFFGRCFTTCFRFTIPLFSGREDVTAKL